MMVTQPKLIVITIPGGSAALSATRPIGWDVLPTESAGRAGRREMTRSPVPNTAGRILRHDPGCFPSAPRHRPEDRGSKKRPRRIVLYQPPLTLTLRFVYHVKFDVRIISQKRGEEFVRCAPYDRSHNTDTELPFGARPPQRCRSDQGLYVAENNTTSAQNPSTGKCGLGPLALTLEETYAHPILERANATANHRWPNAKFLSRASETSKLQNQQSIF